MLRRPGTLVCLRAALLHCAALPIAAEVGLAFGLPARCGRSAADDVDLMMKRGEEFEQQQRLALEEKVNLLARARGWSKRDEHEYLVAVLRGGVRETWDPTLAVAAAFMRVCETVGPAISGRKRWLLFREFMSWRRNSGSRCIREWTRKSRLPDGSQRISWLSKLAIGKK